MTVPEPQALCKGHIEDLCFFTGNEALKDVANENGCWNWVLVGPDPETLPLAGGGTGSITEMRECLQEHANEVIFGLLRLSFTAMGKRGTKHVFVVHVPGNIPVTGGMDTSPTQRMSSMARGRILQTRPAMERALQSFANFALTIEVTNATDFTMEDVVKRLQKVSTADGDVVCMDNLERVTVVLRDHLEKYNARKQQILQEPKPLTPVTLDEPGETDNEQEAINRLAEPVMTDTDQEDITVQAGVYKINDVVYIWSNSSKKWLDTGVVVEVTEEDATRDGFLIKHGSVKVKYSCDGSTFYKWITADIQQFNIRPSARPAPPEILEGPLMKETHNWISEWHPRHFRCEEGVLQWWTCPQDALDGARPTHLLELCGLTVNRPSLEGCTFKVRCASSRGRVYHFSAPSPEEATTWVERLREHGEYIAAIKSLLDMAH